ncbi:type II secretion system minor pseudopilin GspJ [Methylomonas fluvii]|uniref:Type II secretion system protein J n=1 Tax=Methylomonas fluvii TaxID=1854564 RepID=A0ABR9DDD9_9GAMM|nr:type II secretion system minor pseudopilin GspJ [Methylomonas fluvii]MBD9361113.1 type II secretion system minor pseudopilin GspJ [Methylomonas fluvii]CAD6874017.1 General secretion pathway protein J [Methylomonas fluvii]
MNNSASRGFTLLEILIAMAVFAIMAAMAYAGLSAVLDARAGTEKRSDSIAALQQTMYLLNEDLAQALPRSVRDEFGSEQPAFSGGNGEDLLTLTRSVPEWSALAMRSQLQRISYRLENGSLYRQVWTVLDRTQQTQFRRKKLLNVAALELRFYGSEWMTHWPAEGTGLPKAVEANFNLAGLGDMRRLFLVRE